MTAPHDSGPRSTSEPAFFVQFWRYRRMTARLVLLGALASTLALLYMPDKWTSRGSFVVLDQGSDAMQSLSGLGARFGVELSSSSSGYSPRFFAALLLSNEVLAVVADMPVPNVDSGSTRRVADMVGVSGRTPEARREKAISYLRVNVINAMFDQRTGITSFTVRTKSPALSATIAHALVSEANRFAAERHQSRATMERKFVESRRGAIEKELGTAEDAVVVFLRQNRSYQQSPEQTVEFSRLSRRVSELQGVQSMLSQMFEQARIEEVRDSPVLSPVDDPQIPVMPDNRSGAEWIGGGMLLGLLLALGITSVARMMGGVSTPRGDDPQSLSEAWPVLRSELVRPWRLVL